jgi:nitrite reductase/ring-hydroxylating ferredoxin subunit
MRERSRHVVCPAGELPPGTRKIAKVGRREIGVFNVDGRFLAITNICPHHRAPLCVGPLTKEMTSSKVGEYELREERNVLRCPWHSFEFDLETGRNLLEPDRYRVAVYEAALEGDDVVVYM